MAPSPTFITGFGSMHVLDFLFGATARGPRFFQDGWGDRTLCEEIDPPALAAEPPRWISPRLGEPMRAFGGLLYEGTFECPEDRLPECARTARVRLLLPDDEVRGVAVHLAASGDQGFSVRLRFAAPMRCRSEIDRTAWRGWFAGRLAP